jgi:hypothetical protein
MLVYWRVFWQGGGARGWEDEAVALAAEAIAEETAETAEYWLTEPSKTVPHD